MWFFEFIPKNVLHEEGQQKQTYFEGLCKFLWGGGENAKTSESVTVGKAKP